MCKAAFALCSFRIRAKTVEDSDEENAKFTRACSTVISHRLHDETLVRSSTKRASL